MKRVKITIERKCMRGNSEMADSENINVGKRIRKIREIFGLKVAEMADGLEISEGHYRKLERGDHAISLNILMRLHEMYGVDLNYLITGRAREEDIARDMVRGKPEELFYLLHRLLDSCEKEYMIYNGGDGEWR